MYYFYLQEQMQLIYISTEERFDLGPLLGTTEADPTHHRAVVQALLQKHEMILHGYTITHEIPNELPDDTSAAATKQDS